MRLRGRRGVRVLQAVLAQTRTFLAAGLAHVGKCDLTFAVKTSGPMAPGAFRLAFLPPEQPLSWVRRPLMPSGPGSHGEGGSVFVSFETEVT